MGDMSRFGFQMRLHTMFKNLSLLQKRYLISDRCVDAFRVLRTVKSVIGNYFLRKINVSLLN